MQFAILEQTDKPADFPWPDPKTYDSSLREQGGWTLAEISSVRLRKPIKITALVKGELAVNRMIEDVGFTISTSVRGWRLSYGGRVFASAAAAMRVADEMMKACGGWSEIDVRGYTKHQADIFGRLTDEAEAAGEIFLDRVYPY